MRLLGVLATAALLAVGATAVVTFMPDRGDDAALVNEAPAAATSGETAKRKRSREPKLTAAQRRTRSAAVGVLRDQGYRPVRLSDYEPTNRLRVLVGRGEGGQRAFFFVGGRYIGNDTADDSQRIRVARAGNRSVALSYALYREDDRPCCPKGGRTRVLFRWDGQQLVPQTLIPPAAARRAPVE